MHRSVNLNSYSCTKIHKILLHLVQGNNYDNLRLFFEYFFYHTHSFSRLGRNERFAGEAKPRYCIRNEKCRSAVHLCHFLPRRKYVMSGEYSWRKIFVSVVDQCFMAFNAPKLNYPNEIDGKWNVWLIKIWSIIVNNRKDVVHVKNILKKLPGCWPIFGISIYIFTIIIRNKSDAKNWKFSGKNSLLSSFSDGIRVYPKKKMNEYFCQHYFCSFLADLLFMHASICTLRQWIYCVTSSNKVAENLTLQGTNCNWRACRVKNFQLEFLDFLYLQFFRFEGKCLKICLKYWFENLEKKFCKLSFWQNKIFLDFNSKRVNLHFNRPRISSNSSELNKKIFSRF